MTYGATARERRHSQCKRRQTFEAEAETNLRGQLRPMTIFRERELEQVYINDAR